MKNVGLEDFRKPLRHKQVEQIVFRGDFHGTFFDLGLLPEAEFIYHFECSPDVFFQGLPIKEVYYEPYRTFLRLEYPVDIEIHSEGRYGKLYVKKI